MTTVVEKTVRYVSTVETVAAAFTFVMEHLDEFERPRITVNPISVGAWDSDAMERVYEVTVEGRHQMDTRSTAGES